MKKREHDRLIKPLCEKLNALIPIKGEEDRDEINALIADMQSKVPDFGLSWDRELYINSGCDDAKVRFYTLFSGNVHFVPSDDPMEHPGIVVRYKPIDDDLSEFEKLMLPFMKELVYKGSFGNPKEEDLRKMALELKPKLQKVLKFK